MEKIMIATIILLVIIGLVLSVVCVSTQWYYIIIGTIVVGGIIIAMIYDAVKSFKDDERGD